MDIRDRVIVALDVDSYDDALRLVKMLAPYVSTFKIGHQLADSIGVPDAFEIILRADRKICYDPKYYDAPDIVGAAVRNAVKNGANLITVHASGGIDMLASAVANRGSALIIAVTILTTLTPSRARLRYGVPVSEFDGLPETLLSDGDWLKEKVRQFAHDAQLTKVNGIICSPQEAAFLKQDRFLNVLLKNMITPAIRPSWASQDDQQRVMTPYDAIRAGAKRLVVGRPITQRLYNPLPGIGDPEAATQLIIGEVQQALFDMKEIP